MASNAVSVRIVRRAHLNVHQRSLFTAPRHRDAAARAFGPPADCKGIVDEHIERALTETSQGISAYSGRPIVENKVAVVVESGSHRIGRRRDRAHVEIHGEILQRGRVHRKVHPLANVVLRRSPVVRKVAGRRGRECALDVVPDVSNDVQQLKLRIPRKEAS